MESNSRRFAVVLLASGLALAACGKSGSTPSSTRESEKPPVNVVLVVIDTLRADALFDPAGKYDTPNLDRLAREGVAFERAFSAAPMTLPSHVSLFSSRPVLETGVSNNGQDVPADLPLLAEWLADHDYDTRAVLSLCTLNSLDEDESPGRGFESYDCNYRLMAKAEQSIGRLRASLAERDPEKPLFLFAHFSDPHEPYESHGTKTRRVQVSRNGEPLVVLQAGDMQQWVETVELGKGRTTFEILPEGEPYQFKVRNLDCLEDGRPLPIQWEAGKVMESVSVARAVVDRGSRGSAKCELRIWVNDALVDYEEGRQRYALEVNYADRYVGELMAELERLGLHRDSLIVFTSDHGEGLGEHGGFGHVENLSDGLLRVPLIVKLPQDDPRRAQLEAGAKRVVSHIDLVPTVLEVAGLPPLPGQRGTSLFTPHEVVHVAQTSRPEAQKNQLAFRDEHFKMVYFPDEERFELYDVVEDQGELHDVFAQRKNERAAWPEQLRGLYRNQAPPTAGDGENDAQDTAERDKMLRALGYGGGED